jgi:uncharacterized protein (DUF924 family)
MTSPDSPAVFDEVLRFWFLETKPSAWWTVDRDLDALIAKRFGALLRNAERCELYDWRAEPRGRLAEVILLDQFSRNVHRGTPQCFVNDPMALVLAQEAVTGGHDRALATDERAFLYIPYMHSESAIIHRQAERLFASLGPGENYDSELQHKAIIDRFGRFPHRNELLGRQSTAEELAFLREPGSRFW